MISISVIVPVYNGKNFINNFFINLENQSFKNFEIILINDGSTDNCIEKLNKLKIKRLKIFSLKKNKGVSAARNLGIKKAKGEFIYFIDIDDKIESNSLEILFNDAKKYNLDYVCSDFKRIENFSNQRKNKYNYKQDIFFNVKKIKIAMYEELHNPNLGHLGFFGCNGRLIKKSLVKKNNIRFCEQLRWLEDKVFSWRVLGYVKRAKYIRKQLYSYYVYPKIQTGLATGIISGNPFKNIKIIMKNIKTSLKQKKFKGHINNLYKQGIIFHCIQFLVSISRSILLKKIKSNYGKKIRRDFIIKILNSSLIKNSIISYKISKNESKFIPKFISLKSPSELEAACDQRARQVLKLRRTGKT